MPTKKPAPTPAAHCGCGVPDCSSGRKAAGVDASIKDANVKHLRRIEGQVRGVLRMVEEDRYCADIVTQVAAIRESLQSVSKNLLRNHLRHCASAAVRAGGSQADEMFEELVDLMGKIAK